MRVAITGGAGFIGSRVAKRMHEDGHDVYPIDNLCRSKKMNQDLLRECGLEVTHCDVTDESGISAIMKRIKPNGVVHAAALISVRESVEKPELYENVNAKGTFYVASAAKEAGADRMVYISSSAVYGNPEYLPIDERHPIGPISIYGKTKFAGEVQCGLYRQAGMPIFIPRIFNVYGLGQNPEFSGVIAAFMRAIEERRSITIYGDGNQTRDFIHISDVVDVIATGLERGLNETVNIGSGRPTSINEIAEKLIKLARSEIKIEHLPADKSEIVDSYADTSMMNRIGLMAKVGLDDGLREVLGIRA